MVSSWYDAIKTETGFVLALVISPLQVNAAFSCDVLWNEEVPGKPRIAEPRGVNSSTRARPSVTSDGTGAVNSSIALGSVARPRRIAALTQKRKFRRPGGSRRPRVAWFTDFSFPAAREHGANQSNHTTRAPVTPVPAPLVPKEIEGLARGGCF